MSPNGLSAQLDFLTSDLAARGVVLTPNNYSRLERLCRRADSPTTGLFAFHILETWHGEISFYRFIGRLEEMVSAHYQPDWKKGGTL